jgi:hypothetical protein
MRTGINRTLQVGFLAAAFLGGFVVGSATHHNADAQLGDIGKKAMEEAGGAGGAAGSVMELGTAITDMQQHVDGLQKNIETLKKVKSALGG